MSPEQVTRAPSTPRSDLWSLGIVLYEMCTGVRPFAGEHAGAILYAILHESPPSAATLRADLPPHVGGDHRAFAGEGPGAALRRCGNAHLGSDVDLGAPRQPSAKRLNRDRRPRVTGSRGYAVADRRSLRSFLARTHGPCTCPSVGWPRRISTSRAIAMCCSEQKRETTRRLDSFRQAITVDSTYATAHAGLAHLLVLISDNAGGSRRDATPGGRGGGANRNPPRQLTRGRPRIARPRAAVRLSVRRGGSGVQAGSRSRSHDTLHPRVPRLAVHLHGTVRATRSSKPKRSTAENPTSPTAIAEVGARVARQRTLR